MIYVRMKKLAVLFAVCSLQAAMCYSQVAEMQVDLSQAGKKVIPNQFGIFFEEINHAGDGGLYAELIRNGSFTEATTLDGWYAVHAASSKVNLFFESEKPLNAAKARSLRVEVNSTNGERGGIGNEGYWGIAVTKGTSYKVSLFARADSNFDVPLTITIEGKDGTVYGQTQISGIKSQWSRFSGTIVADKSDPAARLVISVTHSGTFWLNMVSLRSGDDIFRADLLQKLKDLKPGFIRFPGGTYVQGNERETAFRWKETIGDLASRRGHQDAPWSYWSNDSMGFHEYLLLCERLSAAPYYVAYAGMTWTPSSKSAFAFLQPSRLPVNDFPMDEMGPIVQDTLDAIEYANGPVTSKWGALRAKAGHPVPFGLKYVEIGNEDERNPLYFERYTLIYNAIKKQFPDIRIIANSRHGRNAQLPMDIVDEHIYTDPLGAIDMAHQLDGRDRNVIPSVLAEYAVQKSAGFGNVRAALAEAVMLGGIERNSEIMPMASYAPMLANVHAINWRPDLIYFDSAESYGTPSYYVQKMFADSRLASVIPVEMKADEMKIHTGGKVSSEGFSAQTEFRDEKFSGSGESYTYTVRARKASGDGGFVVRFAAQDSGAPYLAWFVGVKHRASTLLVWGGGGNQDVPADQLESSFAGALGPQVESTIETDRWYDLKIQVEGRHVLCFLDERKIHDVQVPETLGPSVYGQAGRTAAGDIVVRLVNISPLKQNVNINLAGTSADRFSAVATRLSSKNLDDENSLAEPMRVAPIEDPARKVGSRFQYEIEGNSFTILKLTAEHK
jgi:alpha-L-arabinofuranosidase